MEVKRVFACELRDGKPELLPKASLWEALRLNMMEHMVISFAGGGGKTSSMYCLADELAGRGKKVIVTTTTYIQRPEDRQVVLAERAQTVESFIKGHEEWAGPAVGWVLVAARAAEGGKLRGMELPEMEKLADLGDVLLVEADGAKRLPLKLPRDGEPVHLKSTHAVIGCAGLDCIGRPWKEKCFRFELAPQVFGRHMEEELITPGRVAEILTSDKGTRKGTGDAQYRVLLNKADDEKRLSAAKEVAKVLGESWAGCCVVTSFRAAEAKSGNHGQER